MKTKFELGDRVTAASTVSFDYVNDTNKQMIRTGRPYTGVICGMRRKAIGTYDRGSVGSSWGDDHEPPSFTTTKQVWCYELRDSLRSKPVLALEEDLSYFEGVLLKIDDIPDKMMEFHKAALPLMEYLHRNHNPHARAIVDLGGAEVVHGIISTCRSVL